MKPLPAILLVLLPGVVLTPAAPADSSPLAASNGRHAQNPRRQGPPPILGRWDLTVTLGSGGSVPSWLEVVQSGRSLVGRFCGAFGSARPVSHVLAAGNSFHFALPVQFEDGDTDIEIAGRVEGGGLTGTIKGPFFGNATFVGKRAPTLDRTAAPDWGTPVALFNGHDATGWHPRNASEPNGWVVRNGTLFNEKPGNDLVTDRTFTDLKIHAEYRYPKDSNSGIYLRGRYEVQIQDDFGRPAESHNSGGVYGLLTPRVNAVKPTGQWQSVDITLVGRRITVKLNGELVLDRQEIAGITGSALDSDEGAPGPLFIQGDHGPIEFRKFIVTEPR